MLNTRQAVRLAIGGMVSAGAWLRQRPFIFNHLVTVRCNVACPFCYVSGPEQQAYNKERYPKCSEMSTREIVSFYQQLVKEGYTLAVLVGGETLLRTDLDELLRALSGHMWATVFTNGYLLEERHELVARATNVFVSIDAPDEQHDELRGRAGTFQRALAGIETVRRLHPNVKLTLNMTVVHDNVLRVREMLAFATELDLPISFQPPTYDGCFGLDDRPEQLSSTNMPAPDLVADAFRHVQDAANNGQRVIGSNDFFNQVIRNRPTYPCHYPTFVLGPVMPNGDVVACVDSRVIANVRHTPVRQITREVGFLDNARKGPTCQRGCRDWGIYDLSALRNRRWAVDDAKRYGRAFMR